MLYLPNSIASQHQRNGPLGGQRAFNVVGGVAGVTTSLSIDGIGPRAGSSLTPSSMSSSGSSFATLAANPVPMAIGFPASESALSDGIARSEANASDASHRSLCVRSMDMSTSACAVTSGGGRAVLRLCARPTCTAHGRKERGMRVGDVVGAGEEPRDGLASVHVLGEMRQRAPGEAQGLQRGEPRQRTGRDGHELGVTLQIELERGSQSLGERRELTKVPMRQVHDPGRGRRDRLVRGVETPERPRSSHRPPPLGCATEH